MLDPNQREYLAGLVLADQRKKRKSLAKAAPHPGQGEGDFQAFVDGLVEKIGYQEHVLRILDDDEVWEGWDEYERERRGQG